MAVAAIRLSTTGTGAPCCLALQDAPFQRHLDVYTKNATGKTCLQLLLALLIIQGGDPEGGLPHCRDTDDQKFLALAAHAQADALVSGDAGLLTLKDACPFPIITPAEPQQQLAL